MAQWRNTIFLGSMIKLNSQTLEPRPAFSSIDLFSCKTGDGDVESRRVVGWFRVQFDGSARGDPGPAGAGGIILGPDGNRMAHFSSPLGNQRSFGAEASALRRALQLAKELKLEKVWVQGDSMPVIESIQRKLIPKSEVGGIIQDCLCNLKGFNEWKISHVPRECNCEAHKLARMAVRCSKETVWYDYEQSSQK